VLATNVVLNDLATAQSVYNDWRLRGRIEANYRFEQEAGLDVEAINVRDLEGMRCLFALVLIAAQFVFFLLSAGRMAAASGSLVAGVRRQIG
jgi:hypothetical protein